jgi:acetyltransferase
MKTRNKLSEEVAIPPTPDLTKRPRRIRLDEIVAVRGFGKLKIRPIDPNDEEKMIHFHESISEESIYLRYFQYMGLDHRTSHERLVRVCTNTWESYAVVLEQQGLKKLPATILGIGRLTKSGDPYLVSMDTLLSDKGQDPRLLKLLVQRLIKLARAFGYQFLTADLLMMDHEMINLCRSLNFGVEYIPKEEVLRVTLKLS